eukprot:GSChrysophyteH1.ASY1.ANO1.2532.1 assembled CDS
MSSTIRVALRVRPESSQDHAEIPGKRNSISISNGNTVTLHKHRDIGAVDVSHQYTFDKVFDADATQEEVFTHVSDLIDESLKGYNVTIFAFGMTGSGKTFTISGQHVANGRLSNISDYKINAGIVPRTLYRIFSHLRDQAATNKESVAMVFVTFVELYNNTFYDLLANEVPGDYNSSNKNDSGGMHLTGSPTLRMPVASAEEALALIHRGYTLRATAATNLNERSSRSHTVLTLEIVTISDSGGNTKSTAQTHFGKINLVDLAGSERVKLSGAQGQTLEEAKQINKALSVLGDVLNSLSKKNVSSTTTSLVGTNKTHIPYRNSKLTMMLKDSLGGNAKTMMIATIRLSSAFYQQTLTSLQYAARARHIRCNPIQNLEERTKEFNILKEKLRQIEESRQGDGHYIASAVDGDSNLVSLGSNAGTSKESNASNQIIRSLDPNDPDYAAKYAAAMQAESTMVADMKKQMDTLQVKSASERMELQEKMKFIIHSHEGTLAEREKQYLGLEMQLQQQQTRVENLSRAKENAVNSRRMAEKQNRELYDENRRQRMEIQKLTMAMNSLEKQLSAAKDEAASAAMSQTDREQFVDALKKLTVSRAKHKTRADEITLMCSKFERNASKVKLDNERLTVRLTELTKVLSKKNEEIEILTKGQQRIAEQEQLIAKAVLRIRDLEEDAVGAMTPQKPTWGPTGSSNTDTVTSAETEAESDTAAASATAIVIASTEAASADISLLQKQLENKVEELEMATTVNSEMERSLKTVQKELEDALKHVKHLEEIAGKCEAEWNEKHLSTLKSIDKLEVANMHHSRESQAATEVVESLRNELLVTKAELEHVTSQADADTRRHEAEVEGLNARVIDWEERYNINEKICEDKSAQFAQIMEASEQRCSLLSEKLQESESQNRGLRQTIANLQTDLEAQQVPEDDFDGDTQQDEGSNGGLDEHSTVSPLSPRTLENAKLHSAVSAMQENELSMFATLESKLHDLQDARSKLVKLKRNTQKNRVLSKRNGKKRNGVLEIFGSDSDSYDDDIEEELLNLRAQDIAMKAKVSIVNTCILFILLCSTYF